MTVVGGSGRGHDEGRETTAGVDRRLLPKGAAGVGAAAWVAPQILSVDAAAAATQLPFSLGQSFAVRGNDGAGTITVVDMNGVYTNASGASQLITMLTFGFTSGNDEYGYTTADLDGTVQPFIVEGDRTGPVRAIGTNRSAFNQSTVFAPTAFGGSSFTLVDGASIRLGFAATDTSQLSATPNVPVPKPNGAPVALADNSGSSQITAGWSVLQAPPVVIGAAIVDTPSGFLPWTLLPRTYSVVATFTAV